jgi:exodeoxyribonuclease VII large subunit
VRAATPTAAGELVTKEVEGLRDRVVTCSNDMDFLILRKCGEVRDRLSRIFRHPGMRRVQETVENLAQDLDRLEERAREHYQLCRREREERLRLQVREIATLCRKLIEQPEWILRQAEGRLLMLEPQGILQRGYSILSRDAGKEVIYSTGQVKGGEGITATVSNGEVNLRVLEKGDGE